tara:strand:- start:31 stop:7434 length:7404 start_codon:yes stop_codon:yes gene_type:complete
MSTYKAPDGTVYNIPTDPSRRSRFVAAIKGKYGQDLDETTVAGQAAEFVKAIPRGAASLALDVPTGIVSLFDIGDDSETLKGLRGLEKSLREDSILAADPRYADTFVTQLGEGVGSFGPFLGAGLAGKALVKAGTVGAKTGYFGIPAALAMPTGMSAQADRINIAREMGEDVGPLVETGATLAGAVIGLTEILPVASFLKKVPKSAVRNPTTRQQIETALKRFGSGALQEGGQEVFASLAQDLTARGLYSDELPIGESVFDEFTIGGIIGGTANLVVKSMGDKKGVKAEYAAEKARRESQNKRNLLEAKKVELGIKQGTLQQAEDLPPIVIPNIPPPPPILDTPRFDYTQNPDGSFAILNLDQIDNPIVGMSPSETEAIKTVDKFKTEANNVKLKAELDNALYAQGNVNSAAAFEIGQSLLDPEATTITPETLLQHTTKMSEGNRKNFLSDNKGKTFNMVQAKTRMTKKDFDDLNTSLAEAVFKESEKNGMPSIRTEGKLNTSKKYINDLLASKNIEVSPDIDLGLGYAQEIYTGSFRYENMSKAQKELLVARIHAIPKFNNKTEMPDFRPREYTAQDIADFVATVGNTEFNGNDVKAYLTEKLKNKPLRNYDETIEQNEFIVFEQLDRFLKDLKVSGRSELTEGRSKVLTPYKNQKIRENFDFDIARRAEGFNQTPEEFRATLEAEGKLAPEIIDQLVEKEAARQEKILPPQDIEPKLINYAEAVEQGRKNKFAQEAKRILNERGLKETGVIVSDELLSASTLKQAVDNEIVYDPREVKKRGIEGEYDKQSDIIFLSLNRVNPEGNATDAEIQQRLNRIMDHEVIHALRAKDLINEKEYKYLRNVIKTKKVPKAFDENAGNITFYQRSKNINEPVARSRNLNEAQTEEYIVEEAIAELYRARQDIPTVAPKTRTIFQKIVDFFKGMGDAMRVSGFANVTEVFKEIDQGNVGRRERDEIRTTRELDTGEEIDLLPEDLANLAAESQRQTTEALVGRERVLGDEPIVTTQELAQMNRIRIIPPKTPTPTGTPPTGATPAPTSGTLYDSSKLSFADAMTERQKIKDGIEGKNLIGAMEWLSKNAPSKDYELVTKKVLGQLRKLKRVGYDFRLSIVDFKTKGGVANPDYVTGFSQYVGGYHRAREGARGRILKDVLIALNDMQGTRTEKKYHVNGLNYETILHEAIHAATVSSIRATQAGLIKDSQLTKAYADLENVRNKTITHIKKEIREYRQAVDDNFTSRKQDSFSKQVIRAAENRSYENHLLNYMLGKDGRGITEMLSFGFTNREFQELLESIPFKPKSKDTLWTKFVNAIRSVLGISAKQNTALSAFLKGGEQYLSQTNNALNEYPAFNPNDDMAFGPDPDIEPQITLPPEQVIEIQRQIDDLNSTLFALNRIYSQEMNTMSNANAAKMLRQIKDTENQIEDLQKQLSPDQDIDSRIIFQEGTRFQGEANTSEKTRLQEAVREAEELVKKTPRGGVPYYNTNASDVAIDAAMTFNKDPSLQAPQDIPRWSAPSLEGVDQDIQEAEKRIGGAQPAPQKSFGARLIEVAKDPITSIRNTFGNFRQNFVDKLDKVDKKILQATEQNEDVRLANNTADTATMAALRMADRARGLFQAMLTKGNITDQIEGQSALATVAKTEEGGLIQILAPLYSKPELDQERIFKLYASLKRQENFNDQGRLVSSPITDADIALIEKIENNYTDVKKVFDNYQKWNNSLIEFAVRKGLLSRYKSNNEIIQELIQLREEGKINIDNQTLQTMQALSEEAGGRSVDQIRGIGQQFGIDTRGQAELWKEHSSYYPFYRDMVDDSGITAPTIAGGALPNNPLSISLEGSEDPLNVNPLEAISRNSLSILTASLKNDGLAKLVRDLETIKEAKEISAAEAGQLNSIFVFEDGIKRHYLVDRNIVEGVQGVGGVGISPITKLLAMPAGLLRDTVTRDPGFVVVNILRDTLSSAVTSGAEFTPVIDSVKNMFRDMEQIEQFGVIGGYDFANDEGEVKEFINRTMRRQGLAPNNGMNAKDAFFKLWDGLGELTTKSDGATRLAVYESVYKKLKDQGYTEAQAQSEAAYQSLEIINFGRRGLDPMFRVITSSIPFLNARIQGLDVLYRAFGSKQYSALEKLQEGETLQDVQGRIFRRALINGSFLTGLTLLYYLLVSDTDEYRNLKREVRDDNWVVPTPFDYAIKIPIPFEVGMIFKAIPERVFDLTLGDDAFSQASLDEFYTSTKRQLGTSANIPVVGGDIGIQALKPIFEAVINRNSFTGQDIVPYYQLKREAGYQARESTNALAKALGEAMNISPARIEHVIRGYTGTLGGYVLSATDSITRTATGEPLLPSNVDLARQLPIVNRLIMDTDKAGGLQQQFYELRGEVDKAVNTMNSLKKQQRFDELSAYRSNMKGVVGVKGQVRALERYLDNWRKRRDRLLRNENMSVIAKSDKLREMELERDRRLAFVPELRKKARIPVINLNL